MDSHNTTTGTIGGASARDWCDLATDFETALDNIRRLAEVVEETIDTHDIDSTMPGFVAISTGHYFQAHALLTAMRAVVNQALRPAR